MTRTFCLLILLASVPVRAQVALWVFGADDPAEAEKIQKELSHAAGVTEARVVSATAPAARIDVTLKDGRGGELAKLIDSTYAFKLRVEHVAMDQVTVRLDPARARQVLFAVKPFENRGNAPQVATLAASADKELSLLLENAPFLAPSPKPEDAFLTFAGRVGLRPVLAEDAGPKPPDELVWEIRVLRGKRGEIAYVRGKGPNGLAEAEAQLVKSLPRRLAELESAVFTKDAALMALPKAVELSEKARSVNLVRFEPSSPLTHAGQEPVGVLWLEDSGAHPIQGATVQVEVEGLSREPHSSPLSLTPGTPAQVVVLASIDAGKLAATRPTVAPAKVLISWREGPADRAESFVIPVRVGAP